MQPKLDKSREGHKVLGELLSAPLLVLPEEVKGILQSPVVGLRSIGNTNYILVDDATGNPGVFGLVVSRSTGQDTEVKALIYTFHTSLPDKLRRATADVWTEKFEQVVPESFAAYLQDQGFVWDTRHSEPSEAPQVLQIPRRELDPTRALSNFESIAECVTDECTIGLRIVDEIPYFFIKSSYEESCHSLWVRVKEGAHLDTRFQKVFSECQLLGYQPISWEEKLRPFSHIFEETALLQCEGELAPKVQQLFEKLVNEASTSSDTGASLTKHTDHSCNNELIRILHRRESILLALTAPAALPCVWDQLLISVNNEGKGILAASIATCDNEAGADIRGVRGNVFLKALRTYVVAHPNWESWIENGIDSFKEHDRPDLNFPGAFGSYLADAIDGGVLRSLRTERIEPDFALGRRDIRSTFTQRIHSAFLRCNVQAKNIGEEDVVFITNPSGERIYFFVNGYGIRELRVYPPKTTTSDVEKCLLLKLEGRYQLDKYEEIIKSLGKLFWSGGNEAKYFFSDNDERGIFVGKGALMVIGYLERYLQISGAPPQNKVQFFTVLVQPNND